MNNSVTLQKWGIKDPMSRDLRGGEM